MIQNINIPKKSNFTSSEVCSIVAIKPYVLRFWESEFSLIAPIHSNSGQKIYKFEDVEIISIIKDLLFTDKLTIEEVKPLLANKLQQLQDLTNNGETSTILTESNSEIISNQEVYFEDIEKENILENKVNFDDVKDLLNNLSYRLSDVQKSHNWI